MNQLLRSEDPEVTLTRRNQCLSPCSSVSYQFTPRWSLKAIPNNFSSQLPLQSLSYFSSLPNFTHSPFPFSRKPSFTKTIVGAVENASASHLTTSDFLLILRSEVFFSSIPSLFLQTVVLMGLSLKHLYPLFLAHLTILAGTCQPMVIRDILNLQAFCVFLTWNIQSSSSRMGPAYYNTAYFKCLKNGTSTRSQCQAHSKLLVYDKVYPYIIHYSANTEKTLDIATLPVFYHIYFSRHFNHQLAFVEMLIVVSSLSPNNFLSIMTTNAGYVCSFHKSAI